MATVTETRVQSSAEDLEPQYQSDGEEDGGEEAGDGEESEDGEEEAEESEDGGEDGEESEDGGEEAEDGGEEAEDGGEEAEGDGQGNAGWAEAMAKILGKKSAEGGSGILMKNKELEKKKERERQEQEERRKQVDKKRSWELMSRQKPEVVKDRETERGLQRVATRGVVQLFNAVRKHQQLVEDKVKGGGASDRKKTKLLSSVSKRDFIDVLRRSDGGATGGGATAGHEQQHGAAAVEPSWSVLKDDFMMGASMKDWDKHSEGEEEPSTPPQGGAQDSDSD